MINLLLRTMERKYGIPEVGKRANKPVDRPGRAAGPARGTARPWLYGRHAVTAALANPERHCRQLLATEAACRDLADSAIPARIVTSAEIETLLPAGAVHQGLALLVDPLPGRSLERIAAATRQPGVILVLDHVTDPQNVGAVLRSAAAFSADAVVMQERHSPAESGALAKAASGALESVALVRPVNLVRALEALKDSGFWVVGLDPAGTPSLASTDLPDRCVLVLGAEGGGLRTLVRRACDIVVQVPMRGMMESLNVAAGAAIALYEWTRQHRP